LSVEKLKRRFYTGYVSLFDRFNREARRLASPDSVVLHAGCGADSSIGFRTAARATIGIDIDKWVFQNSDLDMAATGDLAHLPLENKCVDLVASRWVLEHLHRPDLFFREAARVLRPRGYLLVLTTNLSHYFALAVKIVPFGTQRWFVQEVLGGNADEVFPTFYQANTPRRIRSLATQAGLVEEQLHMLEGAPSILSFSPVVYLAGIAYERMVNRLEPLAGLRGSIMAIFRKPE
jgi:SAM-dependent methyltransferase